MLTFIEYRQATNCVPYCQYLGLEIDQVYKVAFMVDHFLEHEGYQMAVRAADYKEELEEMDKVSPTFTQEDLDSQMRNRLAE